MPCRGATPRDYRVLPKKIFLVRHAESEVRGAAARFISEVPSASNVQYLLLSRAFVYHIMGPAKLI